MLETVRQVTAQLQWEGLHVFVLPYPYQRGDFRVRTAEGRESFIRLDDALLLNAAMRCAQADVTGLQGSSEAFLVARTYAYLLRDYTHNAQGMNSKYRLLVRLCMDAQRPMAAARALALLCELYARAKAEGNTDSVLTGCANFLCMYFSDNFQEKSL